MKIFRLRSIEDYRQHVQRNELNYVAMKQYESKISNHTKREFTVRGISYPANQYVDFKVDFLYSDGRHINWRERLICPVTQLNNRLRSCVHLIDFELSPYPGSSIYITEQVTSLFTYLKNKFINLTGSEYLGNDWISGAVNKNNIRHEDMRQLSFDDQFFEYYLSFECYEHIPFYKKAIAEMYRVLKPGGAFFGSFPFDINSYKNLFKATMDEQGNITYLTEPEYHGDPVNEKGILCFTIFGWEILDEFRQAGFRDAYAILLWSDVFGYVGGEQVFFVARK